MDAGKLVLGLNRHESIVITNGDETIVLKMGIAKARNGKRDVTGRRIMIEADRKWKVYRVKNRDRRNGPDSHSGNDTPRVPQVSLGIKRRKHNDARGAVRGDQASRPVNDVRRS